MKGKPVPKDQPAPATMLVEAWPIARPIPYAANPRKNDGAVAKVAASIRAFGFRQPIVVDAKGVVIAGHTRLKAAQSLGLTEFPVHVAKGLTPAQVRAYRLAAEKCDYPLHLGVTAAGPADLAAAKSFAALGALLVDGIGDTLRLSFTGDPVAEVDEAGGRGLVQRLAGPLEIGQHQGARPSRERPARHGEARPDHPGHPPRQREPVNRLLGDGVQSGSVGNRPGVFRCGSEENREPHPADEVDMRCPYCGNPLDLPDSRALELLACPILVCPHCREVIVIAVWRWGRKIP
jgi:4-hydroxy-3-methylbut-2-en-1-yl diphosphate synthase IspG/GcpE